MSLPPPTHEPMTTNDLIIRTVLGLIVFVTVVYVSALFFGRAVIPPGILEGLQPYLMPLLISAIGFMTYSLNQRQQKKVEKLVAAVEDGLGTKIAAGINTTNESVAAALAVKTEADAQALAFRNENVMKAAAADKLIADAQLEAKRILADAKAQAQRERLAQQVAAIPSQVAQIPNITAPPQTAGPSTSTAVGDAVREAATTIREEMKENTGELSKNTEATQADTKVRLGALEEAATPPRDGEPKG